jgi:hypothetical protein
LANYKNLSEDGRRIAIAKGVLEHQIKRAKKNNNSNNNDSRGKSREYYLSRAADHQMVKVCRRMFLGSYGYHHKNDRVLNPPMKNLPETRGRPKIVDEKLVVKHIESFKPMIHHYRRQHAPLRRYLDNDLNVTKLHEDYNSQHSESKISYQSYHQIFLSLNISFTKLGHEECEKCETFALHAHKTDSDGRRVDGEECPICCKYHIHQDNYKTARKEYAQDKISSAAGITNSKFYSADMMKVTMLPKCDQFKASVFTCKLTTYTETFTPIGSDSNDPPMAIIWHDAIAGRNAEHLASAYLKFFQNIEAQHVTIWLDNCSAQNKNWKLLTFTGNIINSNQVTQKTIIYKFFSSGHTFMSSDSFHHKIESSLKNGKVYDYEMFAHRIATTRYGGTYPIVVQMKCSDFAEKLESIKANNVKISEMVTVRFERGNLGFEYKTNFNDDNWTRVDHLEEVSADYMFASQKCDKGIEEQRKIGIIKNIMPLIPAEHQDFWINLKIEAKSKATKERGNKRYKLFMAKVAASANSN